jgi:hypothetical protein
MSLYSKIYKAIERVERLNKSIYVTKADEDLEILIKKLPHGSGIDYDWEYEINEKKQQLILKNAFTIYNESGYRMGAIDFKILVTASFDEKGFDLKIVGKFYKRPYDRDYLYELFYYYGEKEV